MGIGTGVLSLIIFIKFCFDFLIDERARPIIIIILWEIFIVYKKYYIKF